MMRAKINKETDLEMVVNVLENLYTEDQHMLKTLVAELEEILKKVILLAKIIKEE